MKLQLTYHFENEEELRAHLGGETRTAVVAAPVAPEAVAAPVAAAPVAPEAVAAPVEPIRTADEPEPAGVQSATDLDGDGMPYDAAVHADPPSFTADGMWRAKRGKAEEAKSARAAFKAKGGAVVAPVMPVMPGMPGLPMAKAVELPADAPEPVTLDQVIGKITGMIGRGLLTDQALAGLYAKHSGVADPSASFGVFNTNESARANLFNELCEIEPEMA